MPRAFIDIGNVALWAASALCVIFLVQYAVQEPTLWRNPVGITIWGETLMILVIFAPSLLALADPAFVHFGTAVWYQWLGLFTVVAVLGFMATRVVTWELVRRRANKIRNGGGHG